MHVVRRLVLGVSIAAMAAACGSGAGAPAATSSASTAGGSPAAGTTGPGGTAAAQLNNPCTLLSQSEVSGVLGQQVGPGDNTTDSHECDWQYPADGVPQLQASITIETGSVLSDVCDPSGSVPGITVTSVSGIGDGACFSSAPGLESGDNLTFAAHGHVFTVAAVIGSTVPAAIQAADEALARAALAHVGG